RASSLDEKWRQFTLTGEFGSRAGFEGSSINAAPAKWLWFQAQQPELWAHTRRIMTLPDYLIFALTGERVGDAGTAALLGIYDLKSRGWWPEALHHFGIGHEMLSAPLRPGSFGGRTVAAAIELLGLPAGIPVALGSLDHHVAALGSGLGSVADV